MSKTIAQVHKAFRKGEVARSGRGSLYSEYLEGTATALRSYGTTIAIRRDSDGAIFWDGHHYSNTTTRHQSGRQYDRERPTFSFDCVLDLMGRLWWERAVILDWGPRACHDPDCERESEHQVNLFHAGLREGYPDDRCLSPNRGGQHETKIEGYDGWYGAAVLLGFDGQRVLCGSERGKAIPGAGRSDQLWAALLPSSVNNVREAFLALRPRSIQFRDENEVKAKRQGDLYFVPCSNGDGPPKGAVNLDGAPLPLGDERANHRASRVRVAFVTPPNTYRPEPPVTRIWARGNVDHPEHPRLRLGGWHRVHRSAAVRAASSAYSHPQGTGWGVNGD